MDDLGPPVAYLALPEGVPVYDRNGERVGVVDHVLADMQLDIFEGLVVHTLPLPGRHLFADVEQIAELRERGVVLSVSREDLHEPPDERGGPDTAAGQDGVEGALEARLRRAWDWISGRR